MAHVLFGLGLNTPQQTQPFTSLPIGAPAESLKSFGSQINATGSLLLSELTKQST
jgi:hypothetical protein